VMRQLAGKLAGSPDGSVAGSLELRAQRSKSHRIHHEHHCIPIPYQFHDPFGSLHDSHVPSFPHVQA
jgi:hypothetical protein